MLAGLVGPHMGATETLYQVSLCLTLVLILGVVASGSTSQHGGRGTPLTDVPSAEKAQNEEDVDPGEVSANRGLSWEFGKASDRGILLSVLSKRGEGDGESGGGSKVGGDGDEEEEEEMVARDRLLYVELGRQLRSSDAPESLSELTSTLASILKLPPDHARIKQVQSDSKLVEMYFIKSGHTWHDNRDLIPARDVEVTLATSRLDEMLPSLEVRGVYSMDGAPVSADGAAPWSQSYFPYVMAGSAAMLLILIVVVALLIFRWKKQKSVSLSGRSSPSPPPHFPPVQQQICLYPITKPDVRQAMLIQPDVTQIHTNKACGECGTPLNTPPLRLKRGLLERRYCRLLKAKGRGSNASLTLDLGTPTPERPTWGSPPRESSAEEYLLSAGNRMSRKQLRNCLKNVSLLHEEFWEIPMNHPDKVAVPGSGMKNRYRTIIPNETTRVRLPETDNDPINGYINANCIRGYAGEPRAYVATQGPMSHTVEDFWQMIWQEGAPIVVMITKLKEKNKIKCESYLPESGDCDYGPFNVRVMGVEERDGCIIRHLALKLGHDIHEVLHYWYTTWPDHKAPNTARQLLVLVKEVGKKRHYPDTGQARGPVIVHCSAGIGRTGCFIATSIGIQQLREEHMVDVLGIVCSMRLDRGGMIQTNEQYEFVHQALCLYEKELPDKPPSGD